MAFRDAEPNDRARDDGEHAFAATLQTYATLATRLDQYGESLPEGERQALHVALLGPTHAEALLRHLFASGSAVPATEPEKP